LAGSERRRVRCCDRIYCASSKDKNEESGCPAASRNRMKVERGPAALERFKKIVFQTVFKEEQK
jgi:hypothetical protein